MLVDVGVFVAVNVDEYVNVLVGVDEDVAVGVDVNERVGVDVDVGVPVRVGLADGVMVNVGENDSFVVGEALMVGVALYAGVCVAVSVTDSVLVSVVEALGLEAAAGVCVGEAVLLAVGEKIGALTAVLRVVGTLKKGLSGSLGLFLEGPVSQNGKAWPEPGSPNKRSPTTKRNFMTPNSSWNQDTFGPPGGDNDPSPIRIPTSDGPYQIHFLRQTRSPVLYERLAPPQSRPHYTKSAHSI